jgi:molybdate transport system permease protein
VRRAALAAVLVVLTVLVLGFLALPIVAIFLRVSPGTLLDQLHSKPVRDALVVSLKTNLIAEAILLVLGTPVAYLTAIGKLPGRAFVLTLMELPLVLPPAVAGLGLLAAFGRMDLLGKQLNALGITIPFTQTAVVLAVLFVASPFYLRAAVASFEAVDADLLAAARTLGATPTRAFRVVALPLAASGLGAGAALAFARGLGEFGATIMFAGSLQGVTQTLPLAIYEQFELSFDTALAIGALLVVVSAAILVSVKLLPAWTRFASTSTSPSGAFGSSSA